MQGGVIVLIPFYQRTAGLLTKAVRSALNQTYTEDYRILVVDDGSPIPARVELSDLLSTLPDRFIIVEQENCGVAGAKNKGLSCLPSGTDIVAFLDSDDEWAPSHLANAVFALRHGYDFYFADFYQLGQSVTAFNRAKRINVADHPRIPGTTSLHEYTGDMVDQILTGNILGSSAFAYAYARIPHARFREDFKHVGEEYIFWLDLALHSRKIAFSSEPSCRYGAGVNVYAEPAWGKEKYLKVIIDEIRYRNIILDHYPLNARQRRYLRQRIRGFRESFIKGLLHHLAVNRRLPNAAILRGYTAQDKVFPLAVWASALRIIWEKTSGAH